MDGGPARSQPGSAQGSGSGSAPAAGSNGEIELDEDDVGTTAGSGNILIAPPDPSLRLAWLKDKVAAAITARPKLATARITYAVIDLSTGKELVSREPERPMNLASNAKLLTSTAALSALGAGFRWRTAVYAAVPDETGTVAGDLHLRGRGDPVLSVEHLDQLAADVAARGITNVEGRLVIDTSYFDNVTEPPHFDEQPKERAAFRAPIASFAVNRSQYTVTVMAEPGGAARVTLDPDVGDYMKIVKDEVTSVMKGRSRLRLEHKTKPTGVELEITGQIRTGEGSWDLRRRVDDPTRFAAEAFKHALAKHGVKLRKTSIGFGPVPPTAKLVAAHDSPPLTDVIRWMNKHSDNNIAETVLKTIGAETKPTPGPAKWSDGIAAMRAQLAKLGLQGTYRSDNGSGLYAATEVSAKQMLTLLAAAHRDYRIGPDLVASLPIGGLDGTLARRWHGKPALGRVRAKTGTLDKVTTLAGYVGVDSGHVLAFAIFVNDIPPGQRPLVKAMADEMVDALAAFLDAR